MRLASLLPILSLPLALVACAQTSGPGEAASDAEKRVLAAYQAVQRLERTEKFQPTASLSLFRPRGGRIDANFLQLVNDVVNEAPWRSDEELYGQIDYWAQPSEFLKNGGDCEDYAMAKMAILRDAGLDEADMAIEVMRRDDGRGHAVLVVKLDGRELALDNLDNEIAAYDGYPGQGYYRIGLGAFEVLKPAAPTPTTR